MNNTVLWGGGGSPHIWGLLCICKVASSLQGPVLVVILLGGDVGMAVGGVL